MVAFGLGKLAYTPEAGFPLENATPTLVTWTAPDDGKPHRVLIFGTLSVSSDQTGGNIKATWTTPDGATPTLMVLNGGQTVGVYTPTPPITAIVKAGTDVTVQQNSALSAGAAIAYVEIWGS